MGYSSETISEKTKEQTKLAYGASNSPDFQDFRLENAPREKAQSKIPDSFGTNFQIVDSTSDKTPSNYASKFEEPNNAQYDKHGNLTQYTIGAEGSDSPVKVEYNNPKDSNPTVNKLEIYRPDNGEKIVYDRQRSDPSDSNSPLIYCETRDGIKGDLQFGNFQILKDGRINLYFDAEGNRVAISFNPKTGKEEYPSGSDTK